LKKLLAPTAVDMIDLQSSMVVESAFLAGVTKVLEQFLFQFSIGAVVVSAS
jgi:hypothetical protein